MNREKGVSERTISASGIGERDVWPVRHPEVRPEAVALEKRREPRRSAQGAVHLRRTDAALPEIAGRLIDISASGFRAAHTCTTLASGEVVSFLRASTEGRARVVWTRVLSAGRNPSVESGFVVLAEE